MQPQVVNNALRAMLAELDKGLQTTHKNLGMRDISLSLDHAINQPSAFNISELAQAIRQHLEAQ